MPTPASNLAHRRERQLRLQADLAMRRAERAADSDLTALANATREDGGEVLPLGGGRRG